MTVTCLMMKYSTKVIRVRQWRAIRTMARNKAYHRGVRPHLAHDKMKQIWWVAEIIKAMVFPVVMYGCERWTIKKAECRRIDAFELWCWRRFFRVPWTARISNQSILKEISPEYSLEGLMLKLKLQYSGHLMQRTDSLEKTLMLGVWASSGSWWWTGKPGMLQSVGSQSVRHDWATELKWLTNYYSYYFKILFPLTLY